MASMWSKQFLITLALQKQLTALETEIFLLRYGDGADYDSIKGELNISKASAQNRMSGIYKKFNIIGSARGKHQALLQKLQEYFYEREMYATENRQLEEKTVPPALQESTQKELDNEKTKYNRSLSLTIRISENCSASTHEIASEIATLCETLNAYHIACGGKGLTIDPDTWDILVPVVAPVGV